MGNAHVFSKNLLTSANSCIFALHICIAEPKKIAEHYGVFKQPESPANPAKTGKNFQMMT